MDRLLCPAVDGRLDSRLDRDELQLNIRGRKGASCVECACGTGSLTVPLSLAGLKMTGVDLSEQMLASAMIKARSRGCAIPFIRQNMVSLSLPSRVHAVLCTCDGLNYLTGDETAAFFSRAYAALRPGGALLFDVSTPHKLRTVLGNRTLSRREEDFCYLWENRWHEKTASVGMTVTVFAKRPDGAFDRITEKQTQYAHSRSALKKQLSACGFTDARFFGGLRDVPARSDDDRWLVIAAKPRGGIHD